jgi:hypothetical protein
MLYMHATPCQRRWHATPCHRRSNAIYMYIYITYIYIYNIKYETSFHSIPGFDSICMYVRTFSTRHPAAPGLDKALSNTTGHQLRRIYP